MIHILSWRIIYRNCYLLRIFYSRFYRMWYTPIGCIINYQNYNVNSIISHTIRKIHIDCVRIVGFWPVAPTNLSVILIFVHFSGHPARSLIVNRGLNYDSIKSTWLTFDSTRKECRRFSERSRVSRRKSFLLSSLISCFSP